MALAEQTLLEALSAESEGVRGSRAGGYVGGV